MTDDNKSAAYQRSEPADDIDMELAFDMFCAGVDWAYRVSIEGETPITVEAYFASVIEEWKANHND